MFLFRRANQEKKERKEKKEIYDESKSKEVDDNFSISSIERINEKAISEAIYDSSSSSSSSSTPIFSPSSSTSSLLLSSTTKATTKRIRNDKEEEILSSRSGLNLNSSLYSGKVWHTRFLPRGHSFSYRLFLVFVQLDESQYMFDHLWPLAISSSSLPLNGRNIRTTYYSFLSFVLSCFTCEKKQKNSTSIATFMEKNKKDQILQDGEQVEESDNKKRSFNPNREGGEDEEQENAEQIGKEKKIKKSQDVNELMFTFINWLSQFAIAKFDEGDHLKPPPESLASPKRKQTKKYKNRYSNRDRKKKSDLVEHALKEKEVDDGVLVDYDKLVEYLDDSETGEEDEDKYESNDEGEADILEEEEEEEGEDHQQQQEKKQEFLKKKINQVDEKYREIFHSNKSLEEKVRDLVQYKCGVRPKGRICLLTHLSYFGYCFNPVSFYYIYNDRDVNQIETIVAEVSNTPWNEMYCYVLNGLNHQEVKETRFYEKEYQNEKKESQEQEQEQQQQQQHQHQQQHQQQQQQHQQQQQQQQQQQKEKLQVGRKLEKINYLFKKRFHVSPFMEMKHIYDWDFHTPDSQLLIKSAMYKVLPEEEEKEEDEQAQEEELEEIKKENLQIPQKIREGERRELFEKGKKEEQEPKEKEEEEQKGKKKIKNNNKNKNSKYFSATLSLKQYPLTYFNLFSSLVTYPFLTGVIQVLIHYEAVKLYFLKSIPIYMHPDGTESGASKIIGTFMKPFFKIEELWGKYRK